MGPTWPDKWLGSLSFIRSGRSPKWSLTITCPSSLKFGQIIVDEPTPKDGFQNLFQVAEFPASPYIWY
jgi:hypothetical protein